MSDSQGRLPPDDPMLTAYALGELEGEEYARIDALVRSDPVLRAEVESIRQMGREMEATLSFEALSEERAMQDDKLPVKEEPLGERRSNWLRFPSLYFVLGSMAAACFALIVALHSPVTQQFLTPGGKTEAPLAVQPSPPAPATAPVALADQSVASGHGSVLAKGTTAAKAQRETPAPAAEAGGASMRERGLARPRQDAAEGSRVVRTEIFLSDKSDLVAFGEPAAPEAVTGEITVGALESKILEEARQRPNAFNIDNRLASEAPAVSGTKYRAVDSKAYGFAGASAKFAASLPALEVPALVSPPVVSGSVVARARSHCFGGGNVMRTFEAEHAGEERPFADTALRSVSTLSMHTGLGSQGLVRAKLLAMHRPAVADVHIEELLNAVRFDYSRDNPAIHVKTIKGGSRSSLNVDVEVAEAPWNEGHALVRVGIQGRQLPEQARPPLKLLVLVDTEGNAAERQVAEDIRETLRSLVLRLRPSDQVLLATVGAEGVRTGKYTKISDKYELLSQVDSLGEVDFRRAKVETEALRMILADCSRVVLCTDGSVPMISALEAGDQALGVMVFGPRGQKLDSLGRLADRETYRVERIENVAQGRARLLELAGEGNQVVAKGVKLEVQFNPAKVKSYRLLGYEGRAEAYAEASGGDVVSGQAFTALYEVIPYEEDPSNGRKLLKGLTVTEEDLLCLNLDYVEPTDLLRNRRQYHVSDLISGWDKASDNFRYAAAIAGFGMVLRESPHKGSLSLAQVQDWAEWSGGCVSKGERQDFIRQLGAAKSLGYQ